MGTCVGGVGSSVGGIVGEKVGWVGFGIAVNSVGLTVGIVDGYREGMSVVCAFGGSVGAVL